jgi:hypothetical protein
MGSFKPESLQSFYDSFEFGECAADEKVVFGVCRKVGQKTGEKDFDSSGKTEQEKGIEEAGAKAKSDVKSNKPFIDPKTGKRMGWAIKDGKPVAVEWGSVSGEKKVGPKQAAPRVNSAAQNSPSSNQNRMKGLRKALEKQTTEAGRQTILDQIAALEKQ